MSLCPLDRRAFEHWLAPLFFRHPLLASTAEVLPGLPLRDLVARIAEEAWLAALRSEAQLEDRTMVLEARRFPVEEIAMALGVAASPPDPPLHLVPPPKRRRPAWTPEQKAAQSERMRARWAKREEGGPLEGIGARVRGEQG